MTFVLTAGERHELSVAKTVMAQGANNRAGRGRPRLRPHRLVGDKGYSSPSFRAYLRRRGIRYTIPRRRDQHRGGSFDKTLYQSRNRVERLFNRLKQCRRLATRYEKRAASYVAMLTIAAILLWL
jgi:transposase